MATYVVTGRPQWMPTLPPFDKLGINDGVGDTIDLTLSAQDEATLIDAGILLPIGATVAHTILR